MSTQAEFAFEIAEPTVKNMVDMVRALIADRWMAPFEICDEIWRTRGIKVSESGASARIRDLRKAQYGGHTVLIRKRHGTKFYEYRIEKRQTSLD